MNKAMTWPREADGLTLKLPSFKEQWDLFLNHVITPTIRDVVEG